MFTLYTKGRGTMPFDRWIDTPNTPLQAVSGGFINAVARVSLKATPGMSNSTSF